MDCLLYLRAGVKKGKPAIHVGAEQSPSPQCTVQQLQVHTVKNTRGGEFKGGTRVVCATQSPANE